MDKHVFYFQDENLSAEKAIQGTLKVILGADGLSMLALSPENEITALEHLRISDKKVDNQYLEFELQEMLADQKLLSYPFGTVRTALSVPLATLVPDRLFSPHDCSRYFQLLQSSKPETIFGHEEIKEFECHLVWGATPHFQQFVNRYQPRHLGGFLIRGFHEMSSQEGFSLFMNIRGRQAQITVFDLRRLVFYNTFEFIKPTDLLYFVLLVYDQFKLNPEQTPLQLSGALLEDGDLYKMLYKYIRHIEFIKPKAAPALPVLENMLPEHYWFDLLSL